MTQIRILNSSGTEKFKLYLSELRKGNKVTRPNLNDSEFSASYPKECKLDEYKHFETKIELGQYLVYLFNQSGISREEITSNSGLWSWMGFTLFDELVSKGNDGMLKVGQDYRYIHSKDFRNRYRHLVWLPYDMISLHSLSSSRLFLNKKLNEQGDFVEQIVSRNEFYSSKGIVETATRLYFDIPRNSGKRGAQSAVRPGNLRRYVHVLKQLDLTYDLYTVSTEDLLSLLPQEFDQWKT